MSAFGFRGMIETEILKIVLNLVWPSASRLNHLRSPSHVRYLIGDSQVKPTTSRGIRLVSPSCINSSRTTNSNLTPIDILPFKVFHFVSALRCRIAHSFPPYASYLQFAVMCVYYSQTTFYRACGHHATKKLPRLTYREPDGVECPGVSSHYLAAIEVDGYCDRCRRRMARRG